MALTKKEQEKKPHDRTTRLMTEDRWDDRRRILVRLSAALAARRPDLLRETLEEAAVAAAQAEVEEVILQSYLFLGYPSALNAFGLWREVSGAPSGGGVEDDWEDWRERGEEVCRTVYGGQYGGLRENVRLLHPDMERWMVVEGYGKVLGRSGLDLATRELCIAALLAVLGAPRQLYSHLRGALNSGASATEVEAALVEACSLADRADCEVARSVWAQVRSRTGTHAAPQAVRSKRGAPGCS